MGTKMMKQIEKHAPSKIFKLINVTENRFLQ